MTSSNRQLAFAERDNALQLLENTRPAYLARARAVAVRLCSERGSCNVNEVRALCPVPEGIDPRVLGAVMRSPQFVAVAFENSERALCHGRPIRRFRLAEVLA